MGTPAHSLISFALWLLLYASFTLFTPPLLDDADSVHAGSSSATTGSPSTSTASATSSKPLLYWSIAASFELFGVRTFAAPHPLALTGPRPLT
jgi:4-amino-4-deoxy-L-arabinose transferase-like glycosyltransferase